MHPQLELLLEIQDLHTQRAELLEQEGVRKVESAVFELQVEEAIRLLDEKTEELVNRLEPPVRSRYRQLAAKGMRIVAPVIEGSCYGCFMAVPTAWAAEADRNERIERCEHCGRFLYHLG